MSRRKRIASALLKDNEDNEESTTTRPSRQRVTSRILNEEFEESTPVTHLHGRRMVSCGCSGCKGNLVDIRTKMIHEIDEDSEDNWDDNPLPSLEDNPISIDENSENDIESVIQRMKTEEKEDLPTTLHHQHWSRRYVNQQITITE